MSSGGIRGLLKDPAVRRAEHEGRTFYAAVDVLGELMLGGDAARAWGEIKRMRKEIAAACEPVVMPDGVEVDGLDTQGVLRLSQSVSGERAERVRWWLAEAGREKLEDADDPELALRRARQLYEQRGHDRRWVDKRLRGMSARAELTGEWYRRGARASDEFRELTNELMRNSFGMTIEEFRRHKGLTGTPDNLRDHMTELELALTTLAETAASTMHREHASEGVEALRSDAAAAGRVVAHARGELERAMGRDITDPRPKVQNAG